LTDWVSEGASKGTATQAMTCSPASQLDAFGKYQVASREDSS
jgi:hypothetical protein